MSSITCKYQDYSHKDLLEVINKCKASLEANKKDATSTLNSTMIKKFIELDALGTKLKVEIVAKELMLCIQLVQSHESTGIPNIIKKFDEYLKQDKFSLDDKKKIEALVEASAVMKKGIQLLDKLSTPEGQMQFYLEVKKR